MKFWISAILAAVGIWYFFFRVDPGPAPVAAPAEATPAEQFSKVLSADSVDGAQLTALCASHPQLGTKLLQGRQFRISGTIAEVRAAGIDGRRAEVVLRGNAARRLVLVCDLDQYSGPGIGFRYLGKFRALGTELLYLLERKNVLTKRVVTTQGAAISQFATLSKMGASWIEFKMVDGPTWARAETNRGN